MHSPIIAAHPPPSHLTRAGLVFVRLASSPLWPPPLLLLVWHDVCSSCRSRVGLPYHLPSCNDSPHVAPALAVGSRGIIDSANAHKHNAVVGAATGAPLALTCRALVRYPPSGATTPATLAPAPCHRQHPSLVCPHLPDRTVVALLGCAAAERITPVLGRRGPGCIATLCTSS